MQHPWLLQKKKKHETSVFKPENFAKEKNLIIQANSRRNSKRLSHKKKKENFTCLFTY
jgi:hypothetical protein